MGKHTENMIRLGVVVTLGIALFVIGIYYVGSSKNLFGKSIAVYADFNDVSGLQAGNNVRFLGINVGSVSDLVILNDSTLRVKMTLKKSAQNYIRKDAITSIGSDGLVGSSLVNISPGASGNTQVVDGDILKSTTLPGTGDMLKTLDKTNENLELLSSNLLEISEKIMYGDGLVATLLNDTSLAVEINQSVESIKRTGKNLVVISDEINDMIKDVQNGSGLLGYLLTDSTLMLEMEDIAIQIDTIMEHKVTPILEDLKQTTEDINDFSEELKQITADVNEGKGTLGLLLKDESTETEIHEIISNINKSSAKLDENMLALRKNWFFRKYFKKKEKEAKKKAKKSKLKVDPKS